MNCIIIDDEPLARQGMEILLKNIQSVNVLGSFSSAIDGNNFIAGNSIDLVFLDISMPDLNGMDFVKSLKNKPLIIFVTAFPQFALESYDLDAIDYLVKPVRIERLIKAINKAESYYKLLHASSFTDSIESVEHDYVFIKSDRKYHKIFFRDILYIEGLKDYVVIKMKNTKTVTAMNIKTIYSKLPEKLFTRINKSFIVNLENITSVDAFYVYINDEEIPIGESFKSEFLNKYVLGKTISRN